MKATERILARSAAEAKILDILRELEKETELSVADLSLVHMNTLGGTSMIDVAIRLQLPRVLP